METATRMGTRFSLRRKSVAVRGATDEKAAA
jgi:hypothetical protein